MPSETLLRYSWYGMFNPTLAINAQDMRTVLLEALLRDPNNAEIRRLLDRVAMIVNGDV